MPSITVLNPGFESDAPAKVAMAPRVMPEDPVTITIIDNSKPNAQALLSYVAEGLRERIPIANIEVHSKAAAGKPIDADDAEYLAARSHLVISGLGD